MRATGDHFYTLAAAERDNAVATIGCKDEGVASWTIDGSPASVSSLYGRAVVAGRPDLVGRTAAMCADELVFRPAEKDDYASAGLRPCDLPDDIPRPRIYIRHQHRDPGRPPRSHSRERARPPPCGRSPTGPSPGRCITAWAAAILGRLRPASGGSPSLKQRICVTGGLTCWGVGSASAMTNSPGAGSPGIASSVPLRAVTASPSHDNALLFGASQHAVLTRIAAAPGARQALPTVRPRYWFLPMVFFAYQLQLS
jgi:hypothetical protein